MEEENHVALSFQNDEQVIENINGFWEANSESESESSLEDFQSKWNEPYKPHETSNSSTKISFRKLKRRVQKQYDMNIVHKYSTALDVFVRYIQCYHILYSEASYHCNYKLNLFMLPCMFLSTSCSVMTSFKFNGVRETLMLSALNGLITFLLAIINYLKLDANAEAHKISAYQYSKLKAHIEFSSGEVLLHDNDPFLGNHYYVFEQIKQWEKNNHTFFANKEEFEKQRSKKFDELGALKSKKEKESIEDRTTNALRLRVQEETTSQN